MYLIKQFNAQIDLNPHILINYLNLERVTDYLVDVENNNIIGQTTEMVFNSRSPDFNTETIKIGAVIFKDSGTQDLWWGNPATTPQTANPV